MKKDSCMKHKHNRATTLDVISNSNLKRKIRMLALTLEMTLEIAEGIANRQRIYMTIHMFISIYFMP